jgi:hypothetical protein
MQLYHGTAGDFDEQSEQLIAPAWFSEVAAVARNFADWRGKTNVRLIEYRVTDPLRLVIIPDRQTMDDIENEFAIDSGSVEALADWVQGQGYDGWIVPDNYPVEGGSDIMLWATDRLQHIGTTPVTEASIYGMADRIDEIMGSGDWPDKPTPPVGPGRRRLTWKPGGPAQMPKEAQPVKINKNPRFDVPGPAEKPQLNYLQQGDLDALLDQIKAEEDQPPHMKNSARIAAMRQQAMELMRRLESKWVQRNADRMLPRLQENQVTS